MNTCIVDTMGVERGASLDLIDQDVVVGDYVLIHIDEVKGYAILGSPYKHQLWILGRSPVVDDEDFDALLKIAEKNGYKLENIIRVDHTCN